jgi:hypothetical protein
VTRGEKPIELGNSWFSAKSIEVERIIRKIGGRALIGCRWPKALLNPGKLRIPIFIFIQTDFGREGPKSKGKQPRSNAKVPKHFLSGKGSF